MSASGLISTAVNFSGVEQGRAERRRKLWTKPGVKTWI